MQFQSRFKLRASLNDSLPRESRASPILFARHLASDGIDRSEPYRTEILLHLAKSLRESEGAFTLLFRIRCIKEILDGLTAKDFSLEFRGEDLESLTSGF